MDRSSRVGHSVWSLRRTLRETICWLQYKEVDVRRSFSLFQAGMTRASPNPFGPSRLLEQCLADVPDDSLITWLRAVRSPPGLQTLTMSARYASFPEEMGMNSVIAGESGWTA